MHKTDILHLNDFLSVFRIVKSTKFTKKYGCHHISCFYIRKSMHQTCKTAKIYGYKYDYFSIIRKCIHKCGKSNSQKRFFFYSNNTAVELHPMRSQPASKNCSMVSLVRMPPAALIFTSGPMLAFIKSTSSIVAPAVPNPVEVLM